ncbi:phage tailspike polysaccharide lyase family protein [Pseudomonas putida]|uniref:phage tailspike polysaccharide lyase family protein n=1 Tax=Pseudomonas putida TaxID=303 RepID=UPI0020C3B2CD|nr:hypothetical protein [Pseudomonas putida]UTL79545.1 hypothetical protein NL778_16255 [Pseudomonas putida]
MRYNTGNPVGTDGSNDPRDLFDNSGIIDLLLTGPLGEYLNRLGVPLKSWIGIMQQVTDYLIAQGYESIYLTYGAGVVVDRQTQLVQRDGELYRVMNAADIPLTLTGTWATDAPKLQAGGDAALRQALASASGWAMVGAGSYGTVENAIEEVAADLDASAKMIDGTGAEVTAKYATLQLMIKNHIDASWYGFKSGRTPLEQATALQNAALAAKAEDKRLFAPRDHYTLSKGVLIEKPFTMDGGTLDFSGGTDFSATGNTALRIAGQGLTLLPTLASDVAKHAVVLPLSSAPAGVGPGDILCIHNDSAGSWNAARSFYQAGEYCMVSQVSGSSVNLAAPLADGYAASAVKIYKVNYLKGDFDFNGTEVIGPPISLLSGIGVEFVNVAGSNVYGLTARNANLTQIQYTRSIDIDSFGLRAYELENTTTGNEYGLALVNSQGMRIHGGEFISSRHGVAMGGLTGPGSVVNRHNTIIGARIASRGANALAADFHGNSESCTYQSCQIDGGGSVGGDKNAYRDCDIISSRDGYLFFGSELRGTDHKFSGNRLTMKVSPAAGFGAVNLATTANCIRGGTLDFDDFKISGANFSQFPIKIEDTGSPATDRNVRIDGLDVQAASSLQFLRLIGLPAVPWSNLTLGVVTTTGNATPSVTNTTTKVRVPAPVAF